MQETESPAAATETGGIEPRPGPPHADWRDNLDPDTRRIAEKFLSPEDAIRSYGELERRLGRSVMIPDADADQAEWNAFHQRLGCPAQPGDYGITIPAGTPEHLVPGETDKARLDGFLASMHAAGATPAVVQAAIDWYFGELAGADRDRCAAIESGAADAEAALRREWRGDYGRNVAYARRALARFADPELVRLLDDAGIGRAPALVRAFARIGRTVSEDDATERMAPAEASGGLADELDSLRRRPDYWSSDAVQKRVREIAVAIYGDQPAHSEL